MKVVLPKAEFLPVSFKYPKDYLEFINQHVMEDLAPWRLLSDAEEEICFYINNLREEYPDKQLIPFARFEDSANGDIACFDGDDPSGDPKVYFHVCCYQGELPPWDQRYSMNDFSEWLEEAREESFND